MEIKRDNPQEFKLSPRGKKIIIFCFAVWFSLCLHGVYCEIMIGRV